ncbi:MAG: inositol 2-dehydrogenase [Alphaproteobacteria bacterium TMED89]|nr:inositol 2-dehydrogenase [Rhodospirillaceae bacterium]RPH12254.1 MAG: inositol 2-dehydrogenase [Alphaproteobacteria bacterium TMED89]
MFMNVVQFGAGRIGKIHAANVSSHERSRLYAVVDPVEEAGKALADQYDAAFLSEKDALADPEVDAVVIASATNVHADQIERAAAAGKAIFCEKPIDLSLERVEGVVSHLHANPVPFMLAFNRRFDPNFQELKRQIDAGVIGDVEMVTVLSRDPGAPPVSYITVSGGLFRDMMIHDFDIARWLVGEEFTAVQAFGSNLVDPEIGAAGDVDTAVVTMSTASGKLASISNSRRASYGYDQRIEVHGTKGMIQAQNVLESSVVTSTQAGVRSEKPMHFFLERYAAAYRSEWDGFVRMVLDGSGGMPDQHDGLASLRLADEASAQVLK